MNGPLSDGDYYFKSMGWTCRIPNLMIPKIRADVHSASGGFYADLTHVHSTKRNSWECVRTTTKSSEIFPIMAFSNELIKFVHVRYVVWKHYSFFVLVCSCCWRAQNEYNLKRIGSQAREFAVRFPLLSSHVPNKAASRALKARAKKN